MWLLVFVFEHLLGMLMNTCGCADVFLEVDLCERHRNISALFLQEKRKDDQTHQTQISKTTETKRIFVKKKKKTQNIFFQILIQLQYVLEKAILHIHNISAFSKQQCYNI